MTDDSRTKKSLNNIIFSLIAYVIQIILGFLVRRYFISFIGIEYLGLTSLFSNILNILSLAELGFGTAIIFSMYKPMADGDEEKVRQLMSLYKKFYLIVGFIILIVGFILTPFVQHLIKGEPTVDVNLHYIFLILLINTVFSYFFAHRRAVLYTNQRNDIESKINIILNILLTLLQLLILFTISNYYVYLSLGLFITLLNNTIIWIVTEKKYARYFKKPSKALDSISKTNLTKNIKAMIFHKIGGVIVFGTDSILIARLLTDGLGTLGKYSNYLLITMYIGTILGLLLSSIRGSVGNSVATQSVQENFKLREKLNFIFLWIVGFCAIGVFVLSEPFISIILTKPIGDKLLLDKSIIFLVTTNFYLTYSRNLTLLFSESVGLFQPWKMKAIYEAIINLVASVALGLWLGLAGIIIGTIISTIAMPLWVEPHVLNKYYLKESTIKYFLKYFIHLFATIISGAITWFVCSFIPNSSIFWLILKFVVCGVVANVALFLMLVWLPEFKGVVVMIKNMILEFKKKIRRRKTLD